MEITAERLIEACGDDSLDTGLVLRAELEPVAGPGTPAKPAIYAGGRYQLDKRWVGEGATRAVEDVIVIDNVPSQANRLEAQLARLAGSLGLPDVVLDLSGHPLPPHLPTELSGYRFPHRSADAYARDATLDGQPFARTDIGRAIQSATADQPAALFQWFPQALLFGFWQSHLGKKGSQAKLARSWVSEIIGIHPATSETKVLGLKGDPLNLSVTDRATYDENDHSTWELITGEKRAAAKTGAPKAGEPKRKQESLAELGHGQVPVDSALAGVSFREIVQHTSASFAGLRRVWIGDAAANAAGRALLVGLGLVAHCAAFGRAFSLRSGCDLRARTTTWTWLGVTEDVVVPALSQAEAIELFRTLVGVADDAGIPVGSRWRSEPLLLRPNAELVKVIAATYPTAE